LGKERTQETEAQYVVRGVGGRGVEEKQNSGQWQKTQASSRTDGGGLKEG